MKNIFVKDTDHTNVMGACINSILVVAVLVIIFSLSLSAIGVKLDFAFIGTYSTRLLQGFWMTIKISLVSFIISLTIGVVAAIGKGSKILFIRYLCSIYIEFIRGTPLITQVYLFYYLVGTAWGLNNIFTAGVLILSVFEGAYIAEIIRGSILSLENTQLEAAKAVGFTNCQTIKLVVIPQLFARTLPALTGQFASIIKDSSLLSLIALIELTQTIREITAINFNMFGPYLFLGVLYLCLTLPVSLISKGLERRFSYEA